MSKEDKYPELEALKVALKEHQISFSVMPRLEELDKIFYRRLQIHFADEVLELPVCDEYEDVDQGNPVVLLHLLLREAEYFEDADDFLVWCQDTGLNATANASRAVWFEIKEVVPKIREIIGRKVKAVSDFDFEMNTGITQALRNTKM